MKPPTTIRHIAAFMALAVILCLVAPLKVRADVRLPAIISDHMVLQADTPASVWGWAAPGEAVTVSIAGQNHKTKADGAGKWRVQIRPLNATAIPTTLTVQGSNTLTIRDVLIGEVWLGSGQSNMEWPVSKAKDYEQERKAAEFPLIRMFTVKNDANATNELDDVKGSWEVCGSNTVGNFSATLYFFGREMHQTLKRPMGLIHSSWGGTPIQPWMSRATLEAYPGYAALLERKQKEIATWPEREKKILEDIRAWDEQAARTNTSGKKLPPRPWNPGPPDAGRYLPAGLYNAMIHPLTGYRIRGILWYQGEANAGGGAAGAADYTDLLTRMIAGWRADWGAPEMPFYFVQLPGWENPGDATKCSWAYFREGQARVLAVPHTGMAVTIDIGEPEDIHPQNKQDVGCRLACIALTDTYNRKLKSQGPVLVRHEIVGDEVHVRFKHADGGLVVRGDEVRGFTLAGLDRQWHPAVARIDKDRVIVRSSAVSAPVAIRYGWANNPECNLYNRAGLPAAPFRTDDWK